MFIRENDDGTTEHFHDRPGEGAVGEGRRWANMPRALARDGSERWDWETGAIADNLDLLRARAWSAVKAQRELAKYGGCATPLGRVDTDPAARESIGAAVQAALIAQDCGQPFRVAWTMENNMAIDHDADAIIALGSAVAEHTNRCHVQAIDCREQLAGCVDRIAIEAVLKLL